MVPADSNGVPVSCRVSNPDSHVALRSVTTGDEMSAFYDSRMGFFGMLPPGRYQCETVANGRVFRSETYTVEDEGEASRNSCFITSGVFKNDLSSPR